jgi:CspA family cold shock protein
MSSEVDDLAPGSSYFSKGAVRSVDVFREEEFEMPTGTIKKLVSDRGFGFIAAEDGREYFFHRTGLDSSVNFDSLAGGERVNFEIEPSQKGPRANRIKLA